MARRTTWSRTYARCRPPGGRRALALGNCRPWRHRVMLPSGAGDGRGPLRTWSAPCWATLNTRLDQSHRLRCWRPGGAKVLIAIRNSPHHHEAARWRCWKGPKPLVIRRPRRRNTRSATRLGDIEYERLLARAPTRSSEWSLPADGWTPAASTTPQAPPHRQPGVFHHRGACLNSASSIIPAGAYAAARRCTSGPLTPLPATAGASPGPWPPMPASMCVCLRKVALIYELIRSHKVTRFCGAPIDAWHAHQRGRPARHRAQGVGPHRQRRASRRHHRAWSASASTSPVVYGCY